MKKILLILLFTSCTQRFVKPNVLSDFKGIPTSYTITHNELENNYTLDYITSVLKPNAYNTDYDVVVFNPIVTYYDNKFNFYFNITHEYLSHSDEVKVESFILYYKSNGEFKKILLSFDDANSSSFSTTKSGGYSSGGVISTYKNTTYAHKVFYSMNSAESSKILSVLSQIDIEDVRISDGESEIALNEESRYKFRESLRFYKDVVELGYNINTRGKSIKNNYDKYSKAVEKEISRRNFWGS